MSKHHVLRLLTHRVFQLTLVHTTETAESTANTGKCPFPANTLGMVVESQFLAGSLSWSPEWIEQRRQLIPDKSVLVNHPNVNRE